MLHTIRRGGRSGSTLQTIEWMWLGKVLCLYVQEHPLKQLMSKQSKLNESLPLHTQAQWLGLYQVLCMLGNNISGKCNIYFPSEEKVTICSQLVV